MNIELLSFLAMSFLIAVTPGPAVIYVVSYSLRYGTKAGIVSILGVNAGSIVAILISALGLSALLSNREPARQNRCYCERALAVRFVDHFRYV